MTACRLMGVLGLRSEKGLIRSSEVITAEGSPHVLVRIHRYIIDMNFVMDVWSGAASAQSNVADHVTALHSLSYRDGEARHVAEERGISVAVIEYHGAAVSIAHLSFFHQTISRREDGLAVSTADVHPAMECAFTVEGI